ncbi:MAG TPA: LysR family transcriptional regulator [Burkholderiales bacterium]|nr:LysR family transcriptional regulator [Burkholderiales bacterium]
MSEAPRVTLDQWRALISVVDTGSYAKAAEHLNRTQSSITYAVQQLESALGVKAFEIKGRKAVLTSTGQFLYRRGRTLLDEAGAVEHAARKLSAGWEAELGLAVEILFPTWLLLDCLHRFGEESPHTHIELIESVLGGTSEAVLQHRVDLAITGIVPQGMIGEPLVRMRMVLVANPQHPLHALRRDLTMQDLRAHRHLLIRESGSSRTTRPLIESTQRWTVGHMATSIQAALKGYGYAWFPEEKIRDELAAGTLKLLPLREGGERYGQLYLVFADRDAAGPGALRLAQIIRVQTAQTCKKH